MAAPVTDFNSFTAKLNDKFGAGSDEIVTGHIGQNLTRAGAWGEEVFSKAGVHTPAEIGTVMAHMTKLGDKMDWSTAVFTWDGTSDMIRFFQHNQELFENIVSAVFSDSPPTGSGSTSVEITAGQKASYEEISLCTYKYTSVWALFNDKLDAGDLAGAEVLLSGPSEFARNMKRFCLYSAIGIHGAVSKQEPRRASFNATLLKYETLQRAYSTKLLRSVMPAKAMLVGPAIEKARLSFLEFSGCTTVKMRALFKLIATTILQVPGPELEKWAYAQVQQGVKALLTLIEASIGEAVGMGVADRAVQLLNQWAILDSHFDAWAKTRGTPWEESAAWHFAQTIILDPVAQWLGAIWQFWSGDGKDPGSLEDAISEMGLTTHQAFNVMNQELFRLQTNQVVKRRNSTATTTGQDYEEDLEDESSDSGKSDESDEDLVTPPKRRNRPATGRGRGGRGGKRGKGRGSKRGRGRG